MSKQDGQDGQGERRCPAAIPVRTLLPSLSLAPTRVPSHTHSLPPPCGTFSRPLSRAPPRGRPLSLSGLSFFEWWFESTLMLFKIKQL